MRTQEEKLDDYVAKGVYSLFGQFIEKNNQPNVTYLFIFGQFDILNKVIANKTLNNL